MSFRFDEDGTYHGDDGSMVMRMTYRVVDGTTGTVIRFTYLSDNGRSNCQGLSPEFVRKNAIRSALVRFMDNPERLQLYFGDTEEWPHMILVRRK